MRCFEHLQNLFAMLLTYEVAWRLQGYKKRNGDIFCWVPTYYRQDVDDTHDEGNSSDEEEEMTE